MFRFGVSATAGNRAAAPACVSSKGGIQAGLISGFAAALLAMAPVALLTGAALAQTPAKDGAEFLVNTTTASIQVDSDVAALSGGGFVIAWTDFSSTGGDTGGLAVRAQRYDAAGAAAGAEFLVNTTTSSTQYQSSVAALSGGGFVVAWADASALVGDTSSYAVRAQRYDAAGAAAGAEFLVNTTTSGTQSEPSVAALSGGGFVVAWSDASATGGDTSGTAVRAQRYDAAGAAAGVEFLVNTTTFSAQHKPSVAAFSGGGFVVAWSDYSETGGDTDSDAIRAQRYDAAGAAVGVEFLVNTTTAGDQFEPTITALSDDGFVIAWTDWSMTGGDTSDRAIRAQRYDAAGAAAGTEFLVNTTTTSFQYQPSVAALSDGGFLVAWTDSSSTGGDTSGFAVRAQRYDAAGAAAGTEFLVNTITLASQSEPSVAELSNGDLVISWTDGSGTAPDTLSPAIRAQRFSTFTLEANTRVIDAFVTAASDFGGSGTDAIASAIDFDAIDVTGDLQFAVVVQNTDQFDGYSNVLLDIEIDGAVFDGYLSSAVFASGGSCVFTIDAGGLDGGSTASFATSDLTACDELVYDRVYSAGTDDDDMVFTIPVRLTGPDVNFSVEIVRNGDTTVGADVQDNDDDTAAIDPVGAGIDDALVALSFGSAARTAENPLGEGTVRLATLASDYNGFDTFFFGSLEGSEQGLVYDGGALVAANFATHVEEVIFTVTAEDIAGLTGITLARPANLGDVMVALFNDQNEAVFVINGVSDRTLSDVADGLHVVVNADSDAATMIARTGLTARIETRFVSGLGLADTTGTGGIDQISREGSNTVTFEWVGDATKSTVNVFRLTGLGDELPTIRVTLSNSNTGVDGEYVLVPTAALNNGELIVTAANLQTAVGSAFGRADVTFSIEASDVTVRRLMMTNGVVSENFTDYED